MLPARPLLILLVLTAPLAGAAWPQFHGDALHTGVASSPLEQALAPWWEVVLGGPIEGSPVVADGRLFVGSVDGKLYAFDAWTGDPLWSFQAGSPIAAAPAISGGIVYLLTTEGRLVALHAETGQKRLRAGQGSPDPGPSLTSPAIHEGRLYVTTEGGALIAYNLLSLTKDWEYLPAEERQATITGYSGVNNTLPIWGCQSRDFAAKPIRSSPAVALNKVFFGSDMHFLFAVDEFGLGGASAGKSRGAWPTNGTEGAACLQSLVPALGDVVRASPAIDLRNGLVVVASYDNTVRAYSTTDGALRWTYTVSWGGRDSRVISTPAVRDGKVYFGSFNGRLYALETTTTAPFVRELWNFTAGDAIWSSPALGGNFVAFGDDGETAYMLDATTGQEVWRAKLGDDVRAGPAIADGVLYVASADGALHAYGGARPPLPDLVVATITHPREPFILGADVAVTVDVWNAGAAASPPTELRLIIDGNVTGNRTQPVPMLQPGSKSTHTFAWRVTEGSHALQAWVDPANASREFDRQNNRLVVLTPVAEPPPAPPPSSPSLEEILANETLAQRGANATAPPPPPPSKFLGVPGPEAGLAALAVGGVALAVRRRR